ncbi:hypothetical protein J6590_081273 [Homalodisca vitripennis]|nr:hypothetical protein J6590_081273 [Homalodisca vitripennis]
MLYASCNQSLSSSAEVAKCAECSNKFHPACCRIRTAEKLKQRNARGGVWKCESCIAKSESDNINTLELLKSIQKQMAVDSKEFKTSFATLEKSMASIQETMANIITRLSDVEQDNIRLRLWSVECKILDMEKYTRMSNLESVAKALQVPFNNEDISTAHRLQAPKNRNCHASIVVQFARRSVRASLLTAAKKKKLQTTDLHSSLRPAPVFVVEKLFPHNRELIQEAKAIVKEKKLA